MERGRGGLGGGVGRKTEREILGEENKRQREDGGPQVTALWSLNFSQRRFLCLAPFLNCSLQRVYMFFKFNDSVKLLKTH